jgi:endonuclease YncB( thermonuclease family)
VRKKVRMGNGKKWIAGAAATLVVAGTAAYTLPYLIGEKVTEITDGDTFILANEQRIRLSGIDAPELEYCGGKEAKEALEKLIMNKRVILRDVEVDAFGRILALAYVNGKSVSEEMLRRGVASYYGMGKEKGLVLKQISQAARDKRAGIFGSKCTSDAPPNLKCVIKGNRDPNEEWRQYYYRPDCRNYIQVKILYYEGDRWFCSEAEAKAAGFVKAGVCK